MTVASVASYVVPKGEATYGASKHAVHGWLKAVREELRGSGVEVSVVMPAVVDTVLAAGTEAGGVPRLSPAEVAVAVADVLEKPRFEVFVPGRVSVLLRLMALLPQRGRDVLYARMVPDQVRSGDKAQRAEYEKRHVL